MGIPSPMRYNFTGRRCKNCGRYFAQTGRISDEDFYAWSEQASAQKKKYDEGGHHLRGLPAVAEGVIKHREPVK